MIRSFFYEEDGTIIDVMDLQRVRYEFLLRKKSDAGLSGAELKELETNHYARLIHEDYQQAVYRKMMLEHSLKYKDAPKE